MRRFTTMLFAFVCVGLFAQQPQLQVISSGNLDATMKKGDSVLKYIVIKNIGNRELIWKMTTGGPDVTFTKADSADVTMSNAQDRLTNNVWITRDNTQGIYNYVKESNYNWNSPLGTEWAFGSIDSVPLAQYDNWQNVVTHGGGNGGIYLMLNKKLAVHLTKEDLFFQLTFTKWTTMGMGGGFSYTRSGVAPWISFEKKTDTLLIGQIDTIKFYVKSALATMPGLSEGWIFINSNDPLAPKTKFISKLTITSKPDISDNDSPVNLGDVFQNATATYKLQIINNGLDVLKVTDIKFKSTAFTVSPKIVEVPAEGMAEVIVKFTPTAIKSYTDSITIVSNDPDSGNYIIPFFGQGVLPSVINITSTNLKDTVAIGATKNDTIIIENKGSNPLTYNIQFKTSKAPVKFTKKDYADITLPSNQDRVSENVWITRGDFKGIFNIAQEKEFDYSTSPKGTIWALGKAQENDMGDYSDWRSTVSYNAGSNFFNKWYTMYNEETKTFYDIFVTQWSKYGRGGGFSWMRYEVPGWLKSTKSTGTVAVGKKDTIVIVFDANNINGGTFDAEVVVQSNDPLMPSTTLSAQIKVTGGTPGISTSIASIDFDEVIVNKTASQELTLYNIGTDTLKISNVKKDSAYYSINKSGPFAIAPGSLMKIKVSFSPLSLGVRKDTIKIATNDPSNPVLRIPMIGFGVNPAVITLSKTSAIVKGIAGNTINDTISIKNTGQAILYWNMKDINIPGIQSVTFIKKDFADPTLAENQDRIADNVWITRADNSGLYNIALEPNWSGGPAGTSWSADPTYSKNGWTDWQSAGYNLGINKLREISGKKLSLNIPATGKFYDVQFNSWTALAMGGGFSYTRTEKPCIKLNNISGSIASGGSALVIFTYDATKMVAGTYNYNAVITSNDSTKLSITVPLKLILTGKPVLNTVTSVDFGTVYKGFADTMNIDIENTGTDTLKFTSVALKGPDFKLASVPSIVLAGQKVSVQAIITATSVKNYADTITVKSNDLVNPTLKIALKASGSGVPTIVTSGLTTSLNLFNNVVFKDTLIISNTGDTTLIWDGTSGPSWVTPSKINGTVLKSKKDSVFITIDANTIKQGVYKDTIVIETNDPAHPVVIIPMVLEVNGIKLVNPVADINLKQGFASKAVSLSGVFLGYNKPLTYSVGSNDTNVVNPTVKDSTVTIKEGKNTGKGIVTVMALDTKGFYLLTDIKVNVNADPIVKRAIADLSLIEKSTYQISLDTVFNDAEGDALTFTVASSDPTVVEVSQNGAVITLTQKKAGSATITVTAVDAGMINPATKDMFTVTVAASALEEDMISAVVYPNPAKERVYVKSLDSELAQTIELISSTGSVMSIKKVNAGTEITEVDLTGVGAGAYVIKITNSEGSSTFKLVVE